MNIVKIGVKNHMIGKPEWFAYNEFGWGIRPKTWQGWSYGSIVLLLLMLIAFFGLDKGIMAVLFIMILAIVFIDAMHITYKITKHHPEKEQLMQIVVERNVSYAAVFSIVSIMIYRGILYKTLDASLMVVLGIMIAAKAMTMYYVDGRKD